MRVILANDLAFPMMFVSSATPMKWRTLRFAAVWVPAAWLPAGWLCPCAWLAAGVPCPFSDPPAALPLAGPLRTGSYAAERDCWGRFPCSPVSTSVPVTARASATISTTIAAGSDRFTRKTNPHLVKRQAGVAPWVWASIRIYVRDNLAPLYAE